MADGRVLLAECGRGLPGDVDTAACARALTDAFPGVETVVATDLDEASVDAVHCLVTARPFGDGCLDALRRLRATSEVPVVYLAASADEGVPAAAFDAGLADCLALPDGDTPMDTFTETVGDVLDVDTPFEPGSDYGYRELVEDLPDPVYMLDEEGYIRLVNESLIRKGGYDRDWIVGAHITRVIPMSDFEQGVEIMVELLNDPSKHSETFDMQVEHDDGTVREYEDHLTAVPDGDSGLERSVGIVRDIQQRKERERELEQYETIVETMPDGVFVLDETGSFVSGNQQTASLLGMEFEDLMGRRLADLVDDGIVDEELVERGSDAVAELLSRDAEATAATLSTTVTPAGGGPRRVLEGRIALRPSDESFRGVVGVITDVTERRRDRQRLQVLNRVLRHNLRNDLTTVIGATETVGARLRTAHDDETSAELAYSAASAARDLVETSNKVRRIQDTLERDHRDLQTVDVVDIVGRVVDRIDGEHERATVETNLPDQALVDGDAALAGAVENLVENAVVHNDEDPSVEVSVAECNGDRDEWLELRVGDDGPGIPDQERVVVEREADVTPLQHASGIGLWSVAWVIQSFGGDVDIDADETGTVVTVTLRRAE
jgi:PAS domain S-box-containing protein